MMRASQQDGTYPRPQLVRDAWTSLDGLWDFAYDDTDVGSDEHWFSGQVSFAGTITVPFCPESRSSGIGDTGFHSVVWYRRAFYADPAANERVLLHFGAVDHSCRVWVDGAFVGVHVGGQTSFSFDVTEALQDRSEHVVVVRAFDDPVDLEVPRGKQDWRDEPHAIWYTRTTGIWQSVWIETVPRVHITDIAWSSDLVAGTVSCDVTLSTRQHDSLRVCVAVSLGDKTMSIVTVDVVAGTATIVLRPAGLRAGHIREDLHWSPENPVLMDASIELAGNEVLDTVRSYFGVRSVSIAGGDFLLNGVPYFVRAVLEQGYWPDSLMTAPDSAALRREVELIKELGFNTTRVHQKVEDPRFLYWADRLGLMIWGESAASYDFTARAVKLFTEEWTEVIARDRSHPSIVVWVPMNESWGVQDISRSTAQREYVQGIASLTRALDPSRPVISNDGWEHVDSDIFTIHDYSPDGHALRGRYGTRQAVFETVIAPGPQGRQLSLSPALTRATRDGLVPVMVTECGGISFANDTTTWGYALVDSDVAFKDRLAEVLGAFVSTEAVAGFCYTQLTDTMQEANGLLTSDRVPKLPIQLIREMVTGRADGDQSFVWPPITKQAPITPS